LQAVSGDSIPIRADTLASGGRWVNDAPSKVVRRSFVAASISRHDTGSFSSNWDLQGTNMRQHSTSLGNHIMRQAILAAAIAAAVASASVPVLAEPAARKLTYYEYRRGLFALSKIETASVVMLGDSLTEGAPWRELTGCLSLVNRGIGGDTTTRLLGRLDEVFKMRPRAIFLMIGVNDISLSVPRSTTVENLRAILDRLERADTQPFLAFVLPVTASYAKKGINAGITDLNAAIAGVLADHPKTRPIDIRPLMRGSDGALREELSYDGLHLSPKGYAVWRDAIAPELAKYCVP
jgi:lysophospholipase L1-like esterase